MVVSNAGKKYGRSQNPGSYNSQVGVPLSVWQLQAHHQLGIFEAGISEPGEMQHLQRVIQPTLGIFTNIGSAHDEGFASLEQKVREKLRLFANVEALIYCRDAGAIHNAVSHAAIPAFSWGYTPEADVTHYRSNQRSLCRKAQRGELHAQHTVCR